MSRRRAIFVGVGILLLSIAIILVLQNVGGEDGLGLVSAHASSSYLGVGLLVFLDAVCPVFPGETTLNAASTLAAQGTLDLWLVIVAGALGAIAGDSALYWAGGCSPNDLRSRLSAPSRTTKLRPRSDFSEIARRCFSPPGDSSPACGSSSTRRSGRPGIRPVRNNGTKSHAKEEPTE